MSANLRGISSAQMPSDTPNPTPTLLINDLPPKSLVGIDLISFTSSPSFHGVKDIPVGAHFLYTGTTESFSLRSGEWFVVANNAVSAGVSSADIRLRKWDPAFEALVPIDEESAEGRQAAMQRRANLGQIWHAGGLLAYSPQLNAGKNNPGDPPPDTITPTREDWVSLTDHISSAVLDRILGQRDTGAEMGPRWAITSADSAVRDAEHIPGLSAAESAEAGVGREQEKTLQFVPIDLKRTWREGAVGRERTEGARDRSWALGDIVNRLSREHGNEVNPDDATLGPGESQCLGEMQFTFLMVLTLMNFSCLEQWRRLLGLFLTCRAALKERETFFIKVLRLLRLQLAHCNDVEGGLFEMDGDDGGKLLKKLLTGFRRIVDEVIGEDESEIRSELEQLEQWVKREYGWELRRGNIVRRGMLELEDGEQIELDMNGAEEEEESGDYAPVIVDLDGEGEAQEDVNMPDTLET